MSTQKKQKPNQKKKKRKTLLGALFAREEPDEEYIPELKSQWEKMDDPERVKFVFGAILGLLLIVGVLIGAFFLLSALFG